MNDGPAVATSVIAHANDIMIYITLQARRYNMYCFLLAINGIAAPWYDVTMGLPTRAQPPVIVSLCG